MVGVGRLVGLERRHGNTVNHVEGVVVAVDRLVTTHHHLDTATDTGSTGVDFDTCHLAGEGVHEVGVLDTGDIRVLELLHVIGQRLRLFLDTQGGNDHLVQGLLVLRDIHGQVVAFGGN